jgi:preprotein translocase subunit YajC
MLFLQAAPAGNPAMLNLLMIGAMFAVMYFFMIRPQAKKQREQNDFGKNLAKNEDVVTSSGIIGRISKIEDNIITLEVGSKVYIRVLRSSISKELTESVNGANKKSPVVVEE